MTRLEWNLPGSSIYEDGISHGVLYPRTGAGVPWNGLVVVDEVVSGGAHTGYYFDGIKYYDFIASEDFSATIEAFGSPAEFAECDGMRAVAPGLYATQQRRAQFDLSYRTLVSNELDDGLAYKTHLVYNAVAAPAPRSYSTRSQVASAPTRTWTIHTVPPTTDELIKPTAHLVVDSRDISDPSLLADLEDVLYGKVGGTPNMPSLETVKGILS